MTTTKTRLAALLIAAATTAAAHAQSNINGNKRFAWGENIGWLNFADANNRADGVRLSGSFLEGFIWGENVGWINVGNGGLPLGGNYANTSNTNYGVNIAPNGDLFGFAWGENIGWINFDTRPTLTGFNQQARYDSSAQRFRGYAWGENVGWINLDDGTNFVGLCFADLTTDGSSNGIPDGSVTLSDFSFYLSLWSSSNPAADVTTDGTANGIPDGAVTLSDFSFYLGLWSAGCP